MRKRARHEIPTEAEVERLLQEVASVTQRIAKFGVTLSTEERKRTTKMRTGGEPIVDLVGELAERHQVSLPRITVSNMREDLILAQRIAPLARAVASLSQTLADTLLAAQSGCWWAATAYYTALARLSVADKQLAAALAPAVEFFARARRGGNGTTPPAAPC